MHKLLVLYGEPTDREAFANHYRTVHLPLARKLPGATDLRFAIDLNDAPYYGVFEATFASTEEFAAAMQSEEGKAVAADVPNYATGGATIVDYVVETV